MALPGWQWKPALAITSLLINTLFRSIERGCWELFRFFGRSQRRRVERGPTEEEKEEEKKKEQTKKVGFSVSI